MYGDPQNRSTPRLWGWVACTWAVVFAVLHFYWALGGEWGLSESAGPLAEERPVWFVVVGLWGVGTLCLATGALGWLLTRPRPRGWAGTTVRLLGWGACALLLARSAAVWALLLTDPSGQRTETSPEQRSWTLLLWNPWFLVGGLAFGLAALSYGRVKGRVKGRAALPNAS
ncbi:DUF3995 domain-containing protein [Streptomyces sp. 549]|uniref:DUF3995 domain-containing protein n=1 Tax=Streptomyces sp. 549 TaxID=3049076 RepID=UPI0024C3086B|nr:DUF3995 domain-containing protein [Streptomyces sp. 549]MDK1473242.1 DUF3995 domain-containing protein [Streptomyces sp. 549]